MKLFVRCFALTIACAGLAAASLSSTSVQPVSNHLSAVVSGPGPMSLPVPGCGPGVPTCGNKGGN